MTPLWRQRVAKVQAEARKKALSASVNLSLQDVNETRKEELALKVNALIKKNKGNSFEQLRRLNG